MAHSTSTIWCKPKILAHGRQRQENDSKFEAMSHNTTNSVTQSICYMKPQSKNKNQHSPPPNWRPHAGSVLIACRILGSSQDLKDDCLRIPTAVGAGCWQRCHQETGHFSWDSKPCSPHLHFFPISLILRLQAHRAKAFLSLCDSSKGPETHLVSHKA